MLRLRFFFILFSSFTIVYGQDEVVTKKDSLTHKKTLKKGKALLNRIKKNDSVRSSSIFDKTLFDKNEKIRDSVRKDSIVQDSIKRSKSPIKGKISYKSKDYVKIDRNTNKIYFRNDVNIKYTDVELTGGKMEMDYLKKEIYDGRLKDSLGKYTQNPVFKQNSNVINNDSVRFNYDTKKSMVWNSRTKQSDGSYLKSDKVKKVNDTVMYTKTTYVTTSKDPDNPEYYFKIRKSKLIPGKRIITGPVNMYIEDVPTIIGLPFISFPLSKSNSSGIILPTYGQSGDRGFFLQNGGYYITLGDYFDIRLTGDYYTTATYGMRLQSSYKLRYRFSGSLNMNYENLVSGERGFTGYSKNSIWNIRWNHRKDLKAGPNSNFSASVNLGSSSYYRESLNQLNTPNFLNNTLSSSISYSKNFPTNPAIRTSLTMTHAQNNNTKIINMSLPTFQASLDRIYPFVREGGKKKGVLKNINFQYNVNAQNRIATVDSLFLTSEMFDDAKNGAQQKIPIATNFKIMKYISASISSSIEENWAFKTLKYNDYNPILKKAKLDTINGFSRFSKYNISTSLGTTVYGIFLFSEDSKIQGIRHVMRPSLSFNYQPDQKELYDKYISDDKGNTIEYTRFQGGIYGVPTKEESGSIGLRLSNDFEAKVKDKDTTKIKPRNVKFLTNLNFSTSYNMLADSLKWSPINMTAATSLLKNKLNVNFNATLDPYAVDANGRRLNIPYISSGGGLFRITNARVNLTYGLSSDDFKRKKSDNKDQQKDENTFPEQDNTASGGRPDNLFGQAIRMGAGASNVRSKSADDKKKPYYNYSIPWKINFTQAVTYNNRTGEGEFEANSLMFSGSFNPAPRWSIGFNSGFDFEEKGFTYTQINFKRDLKSWQMTFSWTPTSKTPTWYFFIGIKSGIFRDIKYEERGKPSRKL